MNDRFRNIVDYIVKDNVNTVKDRATWEGASAIERATFGRVFNAIEGGLAIVALFGCMFISSVTQNSQFLMYLLGGIWLILFIGAGALIARFRQSLFVRVRGLIGTFMGGGRS